MMLGSHGCVSGLLLIFFSVAATTHAEEQTITVAIVHSGEKKLAARLKAEISLLGFHPEIIKKNRQVTPEVLKNIASALEAVAVMQISENGDRIGVWVPSDDDDTPVFQEVHVPDDSEQTHAVVAFKAGELLRAGIMHRERRSAKKPTEASHETTAKNTSIAGPPSKIAKVENAETRSPISRTEPPKKKRLSLALKPAGSYGFGELPATFHIGLDARFRVSRRFLLSFIGLIPSAPMQKRFDVGDVDVSTGIIAISPELRVTPTKLRVSLTLGALVGTAIVKMTGHADSPDIGVTDLLVTAFLGGDVGLAVALSNIVSIRSDIVAASCVPTPVVGMRNEKMTSWGRPFLSGMVGLEIWLF